MTSALNLNRINFLPTVGGTLDYLTAKYLNIKYLLPPSGSISITLAFARNLPGLAFTIYGDVGYWWVIGFYNGIIDPILDVDVGIVLHYPSKTDIDNLLNSQTSSETNVVTL